MDFVRNHIGIIFVTESSHFFQVALRRDNDAAFALDRFHIESHIAAFGEIFFKDTGISVGNMIYTFH